MKKKLISILIANLFVAAPVFAQDALKIEGSVNLGGIYNDEDVVDAAKMNDIRDLTNGVLFGWDIKGRSSAHWFDFFGENIGREDQYVNLKGGSYGAFKYRLYSDSLTRNWLESGLTPYAGAGTNNHTATGWPLLNTATWNGVREQVRPPRRRRLLRVRRPARPWYFRVDANQVTTSGSKIGAASQGMSPGNGYVDLGFPTEYTTRNTVVEGGYNTKTMHFAVSWMGSKFETDNPYVDWTNGFWNSGTDRTYLGQRQQVRALAGQRDLPPAAAQLRARPALHEGRARERRGRRGDRAGHRRRRAFGHAGDPAADRRQHLDLRRPGGHRDLHAGAHLDADEGPRHAPVLERLRARGRLHAHGVQQRARDRRHATANEPYSYDKQNWGFDAFYRINQARTASAPATTSSTWTARTSATTTTLRGQDLVRRVAHEHDRRRDARA